MLAAFKSGKDGWSFDEAKDLLALCCGLDPAAAADDAKTPNSATGDRKRRLYNESCVRAFFERADASG